MAAPNTHNVSICYTSCSCNRTPASADWAPNANIICYGASNSIAVYKPKSPATIQETLLGHTGKVNCVKWIPSPDFDTEKEFVSASLDKTVVVWQKSNDKYEVRHRLVGHEDACTLVTGLYLKQEQNNTTSVNPSSLSGYRLLIASTSVDSTARIWQRRELNGDCECTQVLSLGNGLVLSMALTYLPSVNALGRDDLKVYLYAEKGNQFEVIQKLSGHEEWIRGLDFCQTDEGDVLLASCSQDTYIRLWRITEQNNKTSKPNNDDTLKTKQIEFSVTSNKDVCKEYVISLESVLLGHDNWVYSVRWHPPINKGGKRHQPMNLLSASMDKTLIIWEPAADTGIWSEKVCVGEVGGGNLGFYGGMFGPEGRSILAHGYQGAFHLWSRDEKEEEGSSLWRPGVTCGGHFSSVCDLAWEPQGQFLFTVSTDQTTRLHAYWSTDRNTENSWHEIARPQVHGYDMQCIALLDRFSFVSGADEKVVRAFSAPKNFLENLRTLCHADDVTEAISKLNNKLAEGASVPALGLSNKAVYVEDSRVGEGGEGEGKKKGDQYAESSHFIAQSLTEPPTEENLLQNTLWPELQKLYGHGNEIFTVAAHPSGKLVASACKAAKADDAAVLLWEVEGWREVGRLGCHSLTVTQLLFSHNGERLLSVSRDRTWSLYQTTTQESSDKPDNQSGLSYVRVAGTDKKSAVHSRIIWSCSWSHDDLYFITVSRDKKAVIWGPAPNSSWSEVVTQCTPLELPESITAVDFAPVSLPNNRYLIAFGLESGVILLYSWSSVKPQTQQSWTKLHQISQSEAHHLTVRKLQFQPVSTTSSNCQTGSSSCHSTGLHLASCGDDHIVRIYHIDISSLTVDKTYIQ